jgi:hypothetical protein
MIELLESYFKIFQRYKVFQEGKFKKAAKIAHK